MLATFVHIVTKRSEVIELNQAAVVKLLLISFALGFILPTFLLLRQHRSRPTTINPEPLRLSGFEYTNPLLVCDSLDEKFNSVYTPLENQLDHLVQDYQHSHPGITRASIYFRDLLDSSSVVINGSEKFIPASLNKVPVMMQAMKKQRQDEQFLSTPFTFTTELDPNLFQLIKPSDRLMVDTKYTLEDALHKMIINSDNGAYNVLTEHLDYGQHLSTFQALKIPLSDDDGITAHDYSYFFRVLYNASYLTTDDSEAALELLTQTDYQAGLVSGVPENIKIAHKFGLHGSADPEGNPIDIQLHDCGIVYHTRPYLLCVMTQSSESLETTETLIGEISRATYQEMERLRQD